MQSKSLHIGFPTRKTTHPITKQYKIYFKGMVTTTLAEFSSTTESAKQSAIMATVNLLQDGSSLLELEQASLVKQNKTQQI